MSETPLSEINTKEITDVKILDEESGNSISGSLISTEQADEKLTIWVNGEME